MNFKKIYILVLLLFVLYNTCLSGNNHTNYSIFSDLYLNGNLYSAKFKELPGFPTCCTEFTGTFGLSYGFNIGMSYMFKEPTGLSISGFELSAGYRDISAEFSEEEYIGNVISGNQFTKGISEFIIKPSLQSLTLEPSLILDPFDNLPFNITLGLNAGIYSGKKFHQEERLKSPDNAFFDSKLSSKTRGINDTLLKDVSPIALGVSLGLFWKNMESGNFSFKPMIKFNYSFINVIKNTNWYAHQIEAGIRIAYMIPKREVEPPVMPPQPPFPDAPIPPKPKEIFVDLNVFAFDKEIKRNEIVTYFLVKNEYRYYNTFIPVIYYKNNTSDPFSTYEAGNQFLNINTDDLNYDLNQYQTNFNVLTESLNYFKELKLKDKSAKITIMSSSLNNESDEAVKKRINDVIEYFTVNGLSISDLIIQEILRTNDEFKNNIVADEHSFIKFSFSDNNQLLTTFNTRSDNSFSHVLLMNSEIEIRPNLKIEGTPESFSASVISNGNPVDSFPPVNPRVKLGKIIKPGVFDYNITLKARVTDTDKNKADTDFSFKLELKDTLNLTFENFFSPTKIDNYSKYIMCYFEFDGTVPVITDQRVLNLVNKALTDGKRVEVIPSTDNIGNLEHNSTLGLARANSAINLLNEYRDKVKISVPDSYIFSNETPVGRQYNRTVIVKIYN